MCIPSLQCLLLEGNPAWNVPPCCVSTGGKAGTKEVAGVKGCRDTWWLVGLPIPLQVASHVSRRQEGTGNTGAGVQARVETQEEEGGNPPMESRHPSH